MWKDVQIRLDTPPSRKIATIAFIAEVTEPVYLPNGSLDQKETLDWLDSCLTNMVSEYELYGSILIEKGGKIIFERYRGFTDPDYKKKIDNSSLFNLGSGNKMFTALCIASLMEHGIVNYTDTITQYLSGFTDRRRAGKITIHHLLSHTSGVGEYWTDRADSAIAGCSTIA